MNFHDRVLAGKVVHVDEINDDIDAWHDARITQGPLHEFLGLTWAEYDLLVRDPKAFWTSLQAKRRA